MSSAIPQLPLPWEHDGNGYVYANSPDGEGPIIVCTATADPSDALASFDAENMDFLVKAVNSHDTMLQALRAAYTALADYTELVTDSYCEECEAHAPKDDAGNIVGPVPHREGCVFGTVLAAIAQAEGDAVTPAPAEDRTPTVWSDACSQEHMLVEWDDDLQSWGVWRLDGNGFDYTEKNKTDFLGYWDTKADAEREAYTKLREGA